MGNRLKANCYECSTLDGITYPPCGVRPPELYEYPHPKSPISLLFLGWNSPKPFGGFWSLEFEDKLRGDLHSILKSLGKIEATFPDEEFLDEFLEKEYYFLHTVKCWTEAKFPGFGRDAQSREGRLRKLEMGLPLLYSCVQTHLANELNALAPQNVCALGEIPFLGLGDLYPKLKATSAKPTQGNIFSKGSCGLPWPLLYTCFLQPVPVRVQGTNLRKKPGEIVKSHLQTFLKI